MPQPVQVQNPPALEPSESPKKEEKSSTDITVVVVEIPQNDRENPRNWSKIRRWQITTCAVFLILNGNIASSITSGCLNSIAQEFHTSKDAAGLTVTTFLLGYCTGPFVFSPVSEIYGRKWIFCSTFLLYMAFNFVCAFSPNFATLVAARFLAGTFASASLTVTPGLLVDLWDDMERADAMAVFSMAAYVGPSLGPIISGFLELSHDWRWGIYVVLWLGGPATLLMFTIPETRSPTAPAQEDCGFQKSPEGHDTSQGTSPSLFSSYKMALTRPWKLLFDPISFLCAVYLSVVYTLQYMLFSIYPIVFQQMRGWNEGIGQLPLVGTIVGSILGACIVFYNNRCRKTQAKLGRKFHPEDRLSMAMLGGIGFPVAMFCFAWTGQFNQIPWIIPTVAGGFLTTSLMLIFVSYVNYLTDVYAEFAAPVMAANTFARSIGCACAPLFTDTMFNALGVGVGGSVIGAVATVLAVIPLVFYRYGKRIRMASRYAVVDLDFDFKDEESCSTPSDVSIRDHSIPTTSNL
ncbi:Fc.00g000970.m01.CDS01 [Cosmosporella sp. VM-42]